MRVDAASGAGETGRDDVQASLDGVPLTHHTVNTGKAERYEIWLDADGLPVKTTTRQEMQGANIGTITTTYRAWGEPVTIEAPSADQTCDSAEVIY